VFLQTSGEKKRSGHAASNGFAGHINLPDLVQQSVRSLLSVTPVAVDDVVRRCQFSVSAVLSVLTELELGGVVEFVPGGRVALQPNRK